MSTTNKTRSLRENSSSFRIFPPSNKDLEEAIRFEGFWMEFSAGKRISIRLDSEPPHPLPPFEAK
jgi:hypothetical protein